MPNFEYTLPSEIDGTPREVEARTLGQLERIAPAYRRLVHESTTQIRNAWLTRALDGDPDLTPEDLAEAWELSPERTALQRMLGAGVLIERTTAKLSGAA